MAKVEVDLETRGIEPHSVTYWESRQVNIGDYESMSFGATSVMKFIPINRTEKKVEISVAEVSALYPRMNETEAFDICSARVRKLLDAREREIRLQSNSNGGTSFDTMKKAQDFGLIKGDDITDVETKAPAKKKNALADEINAEFEEEFDAPSKPFTKKAKPPITPPKETSISTKKKFQMSTKGLFAGEDKTPKPPKGAGIDPDETIDL